LPVALIALAAFGAFAFRRVLTYLHIFQQEEYDSLRYLRWIGRHKAIDRRVTAALLILGVASLVVGVPRLVALGLPTALFAIAAWFEKDPRVHGKKRLVLTDRATRITVIALALSAIPGLWAATFAGTFWIWIVPVQFLPLSLALANLLLTPFEMRVQKKFREEAKQKLKSLHPVIIGITGSYGKTSVKHILSHILDSSASTLMTPGSVNTEMGIARVVRQQLTSDHHFFVCEMGAYGPGSITRLTNLAAPNLAIVTAVGMAHYERFKSLETVAAAKMELAEATLAQVGKVVLAEGVLEFRAGAEFASRHPEKVVSVGKSPECSFCIREIRQIRSGTEVEIVHDDSLFTLRAPLFGEHQGLNIALAFAASYELGISPEDAAVVLASVPQIKHRLEIKPQPGGWTAIDDAYNSNPVGFASGLRTLDLLRREGGRRILATPGMVEMGLVHGSEHEKIGALAAEKVDILLPVVPERIPTLISGFRAGNPNGIVIPCRTYEEAQRWLNANLRANDAVLIENDLPDLYETGLSL
jgi:UDP-N-acetylmuramoyl-tripeptide--D-alanyl-D-alanine ligase